MLYEYIINVKVFFSKFLIIIDKLTYKWKSKTQRFNLAGPEVKLVRRAFSISRES